MIVHVRTHVRCLRLIILLCFLVLLVCTHDLIIVKKLKFLLVIGVRVTIYAQSADKATILTNKIYVMNALSYYCQPINISC